MSVRTSITDLNCSFHHHNVQLTPGTESPTSRPANTTSIDLFMRGEPILVDLLLNHDDDICLHDVINNDHEYNNNDQPLLPIPTNNDNNENNNTIQFQDSESNHHDAGKSSTPTTAESQNNSELLSSSIIISSNTNQQGQQNNNNNTTTSMENVKYESNIQSKPQLFIDTKQDSSKGLTLPSNLLLSNDNSPANSEFSVVSVTSYGSSLPSTPNNSHHSTTSLFNSTTTTTTTCNDNDETDWEIIVKNRNAQQLARMASATGLMFNNNPTTLNNPTSSSQLNHSLTTSKLDTSSLNETSFRKNMIVRHSSDQRIIIPNNHHNSTNGESLFGASGGRQRRKTSFLWGKSSERKNSIEDSKNIPPLDISVSSIESNSGGSGSGTNSSIHDPTDESFFEFLHGVGCRMNVVSIESIESASSNTSSSKETLKKSKFWDKLKVIKKAIKKQLVEDSKPNSQHNQQTKHSQKNSTTTTTNQTTLESDSKSTSSSSLTNISDDDRYTVVITKPTTPSLISSAEDEMRHCLSDPICLQLFDEFCCQECSQENLLLWKELNKVKSNFKKLSDKRRSKTLRTIHSKFFSEASESFDVNVSGKTKVQIEEQANSKRVSLMSGAHVLNSLQRDCINNLCDSFSRFILTEDYKLWKQNFDLR